MPSVAGNSILPKFSSDVRMALWIDLFSINIRRLFILPFKKKFVDMSWNVVHAAKVILSLLISK